MTTSSTTSTLQALGAECGLKVGFSADINGIIYASSEVIDFYTSNFNVFSPAVDFGFAATQPKQTEYTFGDADWLMRWAQANGMILHAGALIAETGNPPWLAEVLTPSNAESIMVDHIQTVAGRYAGIVKSWMVVNEPISSWQGNPGGYATGPWITALGPEYIDLAFNTMVATDPLATRVLNLNHSEQAEDAQAKADSLTLIEGLLKRGVPIQAIGLESHIDCGASIDKALLVDYIKAIRGMGLQIQLSEHDVNDAKVNGTFAKRDQVVADVYQAYLEIALPAADPTHLVFWSPTDVSWMDPICEEGDAEFERADGLCDHRPGLINSSYQLKPAFYSVSAAIENYAAVHVAAAGQPVLWRSA
jgi:endo-1,4-beta-xylanase